MAVAWLGQVTPSPSPTTQPIASFNDDFWRIFGLVLLVALTWSVLLAFDLWKVHKERKEIWYPLMEKLVKAAGDDLSPEEVRTFTAAIARPPSGVSGVARTTIALSVATILSVTLILLILVGGSAQVELVKSISTALVAAFTTIIGFYFGARTSENAADAAAQAGSRATSLGVTMASGVARERPRRRRRAGSPGRGAGDSTTSRTEE
jgi:hypothetical protein